MWLHLAFLLIIGTVIADHNHAWETGNEYHYLIKSRTLTGLNGLAEQYSGIFMRGKLTIQMKSSDTLQAVVSEMQHASVNEILPDISDEITNVEFRKLSLSEKPFEIKIKRGLIRDVLIDQDVPTWEVNLLKSIVSQLQIDTEGENAIASRSTMVPNDNQSFSEFKVMEDSVGGKCEEMITDEKVIKQRFLNITAPLSFAELARYTQSNKLSIYYPVYSFGRMVPKHDNELLETYIPYMATQLRKAIEEGDSLRIQTYIMALEGSSDDINGNEFGFLFACQQNDLDDQDDYF
ncbi:PREDICTED: vitellogenin-1-like [Atta cephalotes]|uniref:Vitellogenin domain-containing protein n=1 Tax=Atta cephalotes TaxID=12957 RepID=A0A158NZ81_ATTCE|nr:PREDICTED: vitellogenin-1-like [Atta cephalotes]